MNTLQMTQETVRGTALPAADAARSAVGHDDVRIVLEFRSHRVGFGYHELLTALPMTGRELTKVLADVREIAIIAVDLAETVIQLQVTAGKSPDDPTRRRAQIDHALIVGELERLFEELAQRVARAIPRPE